MKIAIAILAGILTFVHIADTIGDYVEDINPDEWVRME